MRIYSLFDRKLKEFGGLVVMNNDEAVKRALAQSVASPQSGLLSQHPEDFDLKCLGIIDVERGKITPEEIPVLVVNCAELLPSKPGQGE